MSPYDQIPNAGTAGRTAANPEEPHRSGLRSLDYRDHRLRYFDRGSGVPVVFVHNGGISHRLWDHQLAHFMRSHRVIAPDLLGHGASDRPRIRYSVEDYVGQVEQLIRQLELGRVHLVGCCLGGGVALEFARRHPQQVLTVSVIGAATPKTIASGLLAPVETLSQPGSWLREVLWRGLETPPGRWVASQLLSRVQCGETALRDPSFRQHVERMYAADGEWRVFCNTDYSGFATLDGQFEAAKLPPTLVMWGRDNKMLRASAGEKLADRFGATRREFWDGCGYMLMRERPGETNRVLREFFTEHEVAGRKPATPAAITD